MAVGSSGGHSFFATLKVVDKSSVLVELHQVAASFMGGRVLSWEFENYG